MRLAKLVEEWVKRTEDFELLAPVPLSTVCFRTIPENLEDEEEINDFNKRLMDKINEEGKAFLSHTKLNGKFTIRFVVSGLRTTEKHVSEVWQHIINCYNSMK